MSLRLSLLLCLALAAGCGSGLGEPSSGPARADAAPSAAATSTASPAAPIGRRLLGETTSVALPFSIAASVERRSALLVALGERYGQSFVRRLRGGELGPVVALDGEHPLALLDEPTPTLVTSDGVQICLRSLDGGDRRCRRFAPRALVAGAGRVGFVEQAPLPKTATTGASHAVLWRGLAGDGSIAEARPTGIELTPAGDGMGLCDAVGTGRGAQVLWFAAAPPLERDGKQVPQARLLAAALDEAGSLVDGSELELLQGELGFGHLTGHTRPRLLASASRALYLVRAPEGGAAGASRWLGLRFGPAGQTTLKPSSLVVELDPWLIASGRSLTGPELGRLRRLDALEPSRLLGQPARDAERLAWLGDDGFFVTGGTLTRIDRSYEHTEALAHPFVARRSRLRWARIEPDGSGLAAMATGYAELAGAGELRQLGGVPAPELDAARVSRLKGRWLALVAAAGGAKLIELPSGRALGGALAVDPHAAALVGGAEEGWLVAVIGGALSWWRLGATGAAAFAGHEGLGAFPLLAAVARPGGGVIFAGSYLDGSPFTGAIDSSGRLLPLHDGGLVGGALVPLPGGALLQSAERVLWLDGDGATIASQPLPRAEPSPSCIDGRPASARIAAPAPGKLLDGAAWAAADLCVVTPPSWAPDGTLRWFGSRVRGMDAEAEVGIASGRELGLDPIANPAPKPAPSPSASTPRAPAARRCPADMVVVAEAFCVDRFEARLIDAAASSPLPFDFAASPEPVRWALGDWSDGRSRGDLHARALPLPPLPPWLASTPPAPRAESRAGVVPSAFVSGTVAAAACAAAGKRLCTLREHQTACRGQGHTLFPYGASYRPRACNVFRATHPAAVLHDNAAVGHLDPRLVHLGDGDGPLLRRTGATPTCASRWGDDAIYDLVGNLDEWVAERGGAFAGGAFMRRSKSGCSALVRDHPPQYLDYSTGFRCCTDLRADG